MCLVTPLVTPGPHNIPSSRGAGAERAPLCTWVCSRAGLTPYALMALLSQGGCSYP